MESRTQSLFSRTISGGQEALKRRQKQVLFSIKSAI
jgi:hypothetical protein